MLDFFNTYDNFDKNVQFTLSSFTGVFVFVLILSGNYLGELLPCRVQSFVRHNMFFRHFIGFLTLLFFVIIALPDIFHEGNFFLNGLGLYAYFLIFAKTYYLFWIAIMIIFSLIYMGELSFRIARKRIEEIKDRKLNRLYAAGNDPQTTGMLTEEEINKMRDDIIITDEDKNTSYSLFVRWGLFDSIDTTSKFMNIFRTALLSIIFSLTIIGFLIYYGNKKREFGKRFNHWFFFFGRPLCSGKSPVIKSFLSEIAYAFK